MRRTLNFTGRKRIPKKLADLFVTSGDNGTIEFKAELDISDQDLPLDAKVYLEAYYRSSVMRFDLGTISEIKSPFTGKLDDIQSETVFFRVKVVDESKTLGKILAIADSISPGSDLQKVSLLPVSYPDLGDRIWRLNLEGPDPVLEVNRNYRTTVPIGELVRKDPAFLTMVLPAILREILNHILFMDEITETDGNTWQNQWLVFASSFPGVNSLTGLPPEPRKNIDEYKAWIEDVVDSFSRYHQVKRQFETWVGEK